MKQLSNKHASKGAEEARQQLPSILAAAADGRTTIITRHGRVIAAVVPAAAVQLRPPSSLLMLAGSGKGMWSRWSKSSRGNNGGAKTIAKLRDEWSR